MGIYLVTGGAGFIGSHLVEALLKQGKSVRIFDNFSTGKDANIRHFRRSVDLAKGDLRNSKDIQKAIKGVSYIFHLAAVPSVPRSVVDPLTTHECTLTGTLNLLLAARDEGVKRVVFSSSSSVYGESPRLPKVETMPPNPLSPYALHKLSGEYYCRLFHQLYGLETIALRYFNVFGPRQDPNSLYAAVIPKFICAIKEGKRPVIFGDGTQSRDFCYVENVVQANIKALKAPKNALGKPYNIACNKRVTLNELVRQINLELKAGIKPIYQKPRAGDIKHSLAGIRAAQKAFGYTPSVFFKEGLKRTIAWHLENE